MLGVPLFHGWVVDPSYDASVANIISSSSYDKLKCVADKLEVIFVDSEQISDDQGINLVTVNVNICQMLMRLFFC